MVEPSGICTSGPRGTNAFVPGSLTSTSPETSETLTDSIPSGGSACWQASPTSFLVDVLLAGVRHVRAVIARVETRRHPCRATVAPLARVADAVAVGVRLAGIGDRVAVVGRVQDAVAVGVDPEGGEDDIVAVILLSAFGEDLDDDQPVVVGGASRESSREGGDGVAPAEQEMLELGVEEPSVAVVPYSKYQ